MRTCLGRTTVYAKPFLPIGKLPLGAFKGRVVGDQKSIFRHTTCNFDQTIKPKPQGVGGVAPHAADLMPSPMISLDSFSPYMAYSKSVGLLTYPDAVFGLTSTPVVNLERNERMP